MIKIRLECPDCGEVNEIEAEGVFALVFNPKGFVEEHGTGSLRFAHQVADELLLPILARELFNIMSKRMGAAIVGMPGMPDRSEKDNAAFLEFMKGIGINVEGKDKPE